MDGVKLECIGGPKDGEFYRRPGFGDRLVFSVVQFAAVVIPEDIPMSVPECPVYVYELARWKERGGRSHTVWRFRPDA